MRSTTAARSAPRAMRMSRRVGAPKPPKRHLAVGQSTSAGLPRHRAHGRRDVFHGGAIDEVHRVAERHAERDAGNGKRDAPAWAVRIEKQEEAKHARALYTALSGADVIPRWNYAARIDAYCGDGQRDAMARYCVFFLIGAGLLLAACEPVAIEIGRASCRERV